jgi:hypothetical protein
MTADRRHAVRGGARQSENPPDNVRHDPQFSSRRGISRRPARGPNIEGRLREMIVS